MIEKGSNAIEEIFCGGIARSIEKGSSEVRYLKMGNIITIFICFKKKILRNIYFNKINMNKYLNENSINKFKI